MSKSNLNNNVAQSKNVKDVTFENVKKGGKSDEKFNSDSETMDSNNIVSAEQAEINIQKFIELSGEIRRKLVDLPDVIHHIEKLQKIIQKQVKKIVKLKMKAKQLSEKKGQDAATQTTFDDEVTPIVTTVNEQNQLPVQSDTNEEKTLTENIREAAEQAMQSSGFVYEETSGLYYDYNSGYYYSAEYGLYYDGTTGTYLKYNQETQTYEFHSQVSASETKSPTKIDSEHRPKRRSKKERTTKDLKRQRWHQSDTEDIEEGECSDSSTGSSENDDNSISDSSDISKKWPPCMRMIVESTEIPKIKTGSLFIITCDGGTIGREGNHSVCLPDVNVSKHHLKITYNSDLSKYMITDLGSRNGTILNGKRICASKQESDPIEVAHGSKLQMGATTLLCHIHEGSQTCGHCEPGLLIEEEKDLPVPVIKNIRSINQQYKAELRRLRKQHGFLGSTEESTKVATGYTDRAQKRRETIGSQNPYEKTQTASLDESIPAENKGFKLLSKMGWKEGQSLGKDGSGTLEPIKVKSNIGNSGVGASVEQATSVPGNENKQKIWKKTQERFDKLPDKKIFDEDSDS